MTDAERRLLKDLSREPLLRGGDEPPEPALLNLVARGLAERTGRQAGFADPQTQREVFRITDAGRRTLDEDAGDP